MKKSNEVQAVLTQIFLKNNFGYSTYLSIVSGHALYNSVIVNSDSVKFEQGPNGELLEIVFSTHGVYDADFYWLTEGQLPRIKFRSYYKPLWIDRIKIKENILS